MLNDKQKRFCEEYILDSNSAQASIRAGYSRATARTIGSKLLTKLDIQQYIKLLQSEIQDRTLVTVDNMVLFIKEVSEEARDGQDLSNALKGADMLMRYLGAYEKDKEGKDGVSSIAFRRVKSKEDII